jgi:serine phosphatase RsbU (regulator of sigma subunit)
LYFANNNGVLKYDGSYWKLIETLKEVLSISYDSLSKRVYVGCIADFGYINVESSGKVAYQSLAQQIDKKDKIGKVWDCLSTPDGIYFNTEKELIRYKNGTFKTWQSKSYFHAVFYAGAKVLIREAGTGLLCIENEILSFVQGSETFAENIISYIGSIKNKPNEFVLASRNKGFLKFELTKINDEFSIKLNLINKNTVDLFNKNIILSGTRLNDNQYAISTMLGGLIIIDENGNVKSHLNSKNGLTCDVINNTFQDQLGNLWLSTDNGISLVMWTLPVREYQNNANITGIVESIAEINNTLFVGTSTGIYKNNSKLNQFEKLDFPTIQVWQLVNIEEENILLAATKNGIYKIDIQGNIKLLSNELEDVLTITKSKKFNNIFYIGHLSGFATYKYEHGQLKLLSDFSNFNYEVRQILEDSYGSIWLSTKYDGLICMLNPNLYNIQNLNLVNYIKYTTVNGLPHMNANFAYEINNKILVATMYGVYRLDETKPRSSYTIDELAKLPFVKDFSIYPYAKNQLNQIKKIKIDEKNNIWILTLLPDVKYDFGVIENKNKEVKLFNKPFKTITKDKINEFFLDSNHIWFGGTDMIHCFHKSKKYDFNHSFHCLIRSVSSINDTIFAGNYYSQVKIGDNIVNQMSLIQPEDLKKSFAYQKNDFTFQFTASSYIVDNPCKFSCFLEGEDKKWSEWSNETSKTFMNLYEGKYVFKVKAKNIFGTESTIACYEFTIHPPWYRTTLAYILYFVLAFGFIYGVVVIFTRNLNRIIKNQTAELQHQKDEIVHKNKEITDSIYYAKRIQDAIMPSNEYIKNMFEDSFVFFKPKDIVSGDFYWANLRENNAILAAVDCTGHGVPGAFMSMMGNDYLNDIIVDSKINEPNEILNRMRSGIIKALKQRGESGESKDGMDMSLVNINKETLMLEYAGANNPLYIVRDKSRPAIENAIIFSTETDKKILFELKGNKFPVGIHMGTTLQPFIKREIQLFHGDVVYMFSDGYADQFGGPLAKKLKYNQFKKFILESMFLTMEEQKIYLEQMLNEWQGDLEQVDDVLVIGVRII